MKRRRPIPPPPRCVNRAFTERGLNDVFSIDSMPVEPGERFRVVFESVASEYPQGVWVGAGGLLAANGETAPSFAIWQESAPLEGLEFECLETPGSLSLYNIWRSEFGRQSQANSSGMLIKDLPNGRRYRCNDLGWDLRFDKVVFRIERCGRREVSPPP